MKLSEKRILFSLLISELIVWAHTQGITVAFDEVKRSPEVAKIYAEQGKGISNSLHTLGLAADLIRYEGTAYLSSSHDYKVLGDKWKSMHSLARWGGDFRRADGGHFSLEHNGVK